MKIFRTSDYIMIASWLAAFILSLPLVPPQDIARLGAIVCIFVFAAAGIGRELAGPGLPVSKSPVMQIFPALWLLSLLSVLWSASQLDSFLAFSSLGLLVLGFVVFAAGRGIFRVLIPLAPLMLLVLAGLSLFAIVQYVFLPGMLVNGGVRYPFANPNSFAALLMLGFFPALGWMLCAVAPKVRMAATIVTLILVCGIAVVAGKAVILLTAFGLLIMLAGCWKRITMHAKSFWGVVLAGALSLAALQLFPAAGRVPVTERMTQMAGGDTASMDTRLDIWRATWHMIHHHLWFGTGYGTFYLFYPQYRMAGDAASSGLMAHNDLLQFWAEMGVFAPLLMLMFYIGALWRMKKVMDLRDSNSGERALCVALFTGAAMVALHSLVDFDMYVGSVLCLLGMVLGLWFRYTALVLGDRTGTVGLPACCPPNAGRAAIILPLIVIAFLAQGFLMSQYHVRAAQAAGNAGQLEQFAHHVNLAQRTSFGRSASAYVLAAGVPVGLLQRQDWPMSDMTKAQLARQAEALLDKAELYNPRLVSIYYDHAVMAVNGLDKGNEAARAFLQRALALNPYHMPSRMMLADIDYREGHKDTALRTLKEGLDLPPLDRDPRAYYNMTARIAVEQGDNDTAGLAMTRMVKWQQSTGKRLAMAQETVPTPLAPGEPVKAAAP